MLKKKEIIICIISIILLAIVSTTSLAAPSLSDTLGNNSDNNDAQFTNIIQGNNTPTPTPTPNNTNNTNNTNNINNTNNTNNTLPSTGVDYSVILIIAICSISAIYAYKKIRDYNI